jgi:acetyltransferase-like isoleucine patch superfamily enzyme
MKPTHYYTEFELLEFGIAQVGENVRVSSLSTIVGIENLYLGSNIRIDSYVTVIASRGPLRIGNNVHIEPSSSIVSHFGVSIGNYCTLSHGVRIFTASADYSGDHLTNSFPEPKFQKPVAGRIIIQDHVIIGANSVVMPNLTISEGAAIGALSFVRKSLEGWTIYGGNPLRIIRTRNNKISEFDNRTIL